MAQKYLFKVGQKLRIISVSQVHCLTMNQAIAFGIASAEEQRRQLLADALGKERFFYGRNVVQGLEISLQKLEEIFPDIRQQISLLTLAQQSN